MSGEGDELWTTAVWALEALGLSEYAARTLVALTRIGGGSARDVSETSSVPRTRVYDAVEELSTWGFVRVRESRPKRFEPVAPERIRRTFYREYVFRQLFTEWGLRALRPEESSPERCDAAVETDADAIHRQFLSAIAEADEEVTYVAVKGTPRDDVLGALDDAADRGVTVRIVCVDDADAASVDESVPAATVLCVPGTPPDGPRRILVVDESTVVLGTGRAEGGPASDVGLSARRVGADVAALLRQVVDAWVADTA